MKKFTFLFLAGMLALAMSVSAQRVILNSNTNYEVQIDGRVYSETVGTRTITDLQQGAHTITVHQVTSKGIFGLGKKTNLLSSEQFTLGNSDINIDVDQNGRTRIYGSGYSNNGNTTTTDGNWNTNNTPAGKYGKSEGKGRGHKYGHYKNKNKDKKQKKNKQRDRDDD